MWLIEIFKIPYRAATSGPEVERVIIDTDAGPDDAAAIFVVLNYNKYSYNSSLEVLAITCVHGNTAVDNVVVNVLKTLQTANRLDVSSSYLLC